MGWAYAFKPRCNCHFVVLRFWFDRRISGSPENRTQRDRLSAGFGQPALDYRSVFHFSRDGRNRTDTIVLPRHAGLPLPNIPLFRFQWLVWESNPSPRLERAVSSDR